MTAPTPGRQPTGRPSFLGSALTTYGTNVATAALSLLNVLIVARVLGATGRGDVAFLVTVAVITAYVGALGVQEASANLAGSEPSLRRGLATNAVIFAIVFGAAMAGAVLALVALVPSVGGEVERALLWVALASVPTVLLKTYLSFLVQADYGFRVSNLAWLLGPLTSAVVNSVLAAVGLLSVTAAIAAWVGGQALGTLVLAVYIARRAGFGRPSGALARRTLAFGLKAHLGRFMAVGNYRVDQWFVGAIAGSRELGLYSVAVAWAEVLFYLPGVLVIVQRPDIVRATRAEAAALAARIFRVALLLSLPLMAVLVLAAPVLCVTVFGEEFRGSIDDLRVLAAGALGIVALELLGNALTAQRRPMLTVAAVAVAFVATIALDVVLIPELGGLGAAIASALAYWGGGLVVAAIFVRAMGSRARELVPAWTDVRWIRSDLRGRLSRRTEVAREPS